MQMWVDGKESPSSTYGKSNMTNNLIGQFNSMKIAIESEPRRILGSQPRNLN